MALSNPSPACKRLAPASVRSTFYGVHSLKPVGQGEDGADGINCQ